MKSISSIGAIFKYPDFDADGLRSYEEYATAISGSMARNIMLGAIIVTAPFWPTDYLIFADRPEIINALLIWRISVSVIGVLTIILLKYFKYFSDRPILVFNVTGFLIMFITGYALGQTGGIENPTFYGIYPVPFLTTVLIMKLRWRIVSTYLLPLAYMIGFFAPFPENLDHPLVANPLVFMFGVCITIIIAGHAVNRLFANNYYRHLALEKKAKELLEYRTKLERQIEVSKQAEFELGEAKKELEQRVNQRASELELANERLTELATNLVTIQEEERKRISSELHDELGQLLTRLRMENYFLLNLMPQDHPKYEEFKSASERSAQIIGKLQKSTRELMMFLRSKVLEDDGLKAALEVLIEDLKTDAISIFHWSWDRDESEFSPYVLKAIYRIMQESITNIRRHANATQVEIFCRQNEDEIVIEILDDGRGFDPESDSHHEGLGLKGMRERARSLGGEITVHSEIGSGTKVIARIPIRRNMIEE
jgi:signal transduction histidine kinase